MMSEQLSQPLPLSQVGSQPASSANFSASEEDIRLVEALRRGDEAAFVSLLDRYHTSLLRLALMYTSSQTLAEEIVQETWIGVLQGIQRFEGRSSLKTWIYRILMNQAKKRAQREDRQIPFSALGVLKFRRAERLSVTTPADSEIGPVPSAPSPQAHACPPLYSTALNLM